jgi:hypothetical protein
MRITITCEDCGRRHRLERSVSDPGPIWIVCHGCETPLRADLESNHTAQLGAQFAGAWGGILDLSPLASPGTAG